MGFVNLTLVTARLAKRRGLVCVVAISIATVLMVGNSQSQLLIYPAQGQSYQQQSMDEGQCHQWAEQRTGFNPYYASPSSGTSTGSALLGGAARGGLLGAIGGAIAGDAGKGAAIGAGIGAVGGLMRKNSYERQAQAEYDAGLSAYNRAFVACMEGRGYVVR